jgi:hypothetical protein
MPGTIALIIRQYQVIGGIAFATFLGCVHTEHPLSQTGKVVVDPELVGEWFLIDDPFWGSDESRGIRISMVGKDLYRFDDLEDNSDAAYEAKLVEAGGKSYLEIQSMGGTALTESDGVWPSSFVQIERKGDWIAFRVPDANAFREYVIAGTEITGEYRGGYPFCSVTVSSSSDKLAKFLAKHGNEVLQGRQVFRRKDIP